MRMKRLQSPNHHQPPYGLAQCHQLPGLSITPSRLLAPPRFRRQEDEITVNHIPPSIKSVLLSATTEQTACLCQPHVDVP